jgi:hypothetical protein
MEDRTILLVESFHLQRTCRFATPLTVHMVLDHENRVIFSNYRCWMVVVRVHYTDGTGFETDRHDPKRFYHCRKLVIRTHVLLNLRRRGLKVNITQEKQVGPRAV